MMMRRRPLPATLGTEIVMLGRVGVAGEADREATLAERRQQRLAVRQIDRGVGRVEVVAERDMKPDDEERVGRRLRQHGSEKIEWRDVEPTLVFVAADIV